MGTRTGIEGEVVTGGRVEIAVHITEALRLIGADAQG